MKYYFIFFIIYSNYTVFTYTMQKDIIDCIRENKLKCLVELIENGIDPNKNHGEPIKHKPLIFAAQEKNIEAIKLLLQNGANINEQDDNGFTALIIASKDGSVDIVQLLLQHQVDISIKNNHGCDAVFWANKEIERLLILNKIRKKSNVYDIIKQKQIS